MLCCGDARAAAVLCSRHAQLLSCPARVHAADAIAFAKPASTQALDRRIAEALDCPCVEDLKSGPCGELFVNTFTCYQKSRAEPKGCDCLDVSLAFAVSWHTHVLGSSSRRLHGVHHKVGDKTVGVAA